ncbi:hypothetical protein [Bacillus sp. ISL-55]|uniref:hypothetical protein n=1 Tax=Bacillus sp. ISL-55 TaxID=2819134 RepID=UPI001BEB42B1|nr:hypothetical protein [Bacillus sp. ISL-55]MBT2691616.1 hypothetical protein [Bacillus sp. ISL-55]
MGYNRNDNDVAGVFYPNRDRDRVRATVDFDDLCRAVRRCLIEDLVAGARDDRDDDRDRRRKKCGCRN